MTDERLKKELVRDGLFTGINNHLRTIASKSSVISIPVSPATAKEMLAISNETFLAWKLENTIAFKAGSLWACVFPIELEFGSVGFFEEGGKLENPEKNPWSKDENQQQTRPTYHAGSVN